MRIGRFSDAVATNEKVIAGIEGIRKDLGEDFAIVVSKFYNQQASLAFVTGNIDLAIEAAEKGIELTQQVQTDEEDTRRASLHTMRDLLNLLTRAKAKKDGRKASDIRKELSRLHGVPTTFMGIHAE